MLCKSCRSSCTPLWPSRECQCRVLGHAILLDKLQLQIVPLRMASQLLSLHKQNRLQKVETPWQQGQEGG